MNIIDALDDEQVFAPHFRGGTWDAWRVFLKALFALPMTEAQLALYRKHTGRTTPPSEPLHEAWLVCGRRSGKSFILALISVFLATFRDWRPYLGPGEVGTVMIIARDRRQARVIKRYVHGLLTAVPMLRRVVEADVVESITLRNRIVIEIHTASFRAVRGYTIIAALLDEIAFWPTTDDASDPDSEVINALRPGMATIPGAMLLCASSPYARRGALWDAHRKHFGKDGPVLVWHAPTRDMNVTVPQLVIDEAVEEDPAWANAEYMAQFRADIEGFVSLEVVEACIGDYREQLPSSGNGYGAFVDPSGGSADSFALAISHRDGNDTIVIDCIRETRPPFSPEQVITDYAALLKSYRVTQVTGDRYAGEFPRELFRKHGITYELATRTKSELFRDLLPLLNSSRIMIPRDDRLIAQLVTLERRVSAGGRENITHPDHGHDDLANAIAGTASLSKYGGYEWRVHLPGRDWIGSGSTERRWRFPTIA